MKKNLLGIIALLFVVFSFISCGDDDSNQDENLEPIIGTWYYIGQSNYDGTQFEEGDACDKNMYLNFKVDGTGIAQDIEFFNNKCTVLPLENFSWEQTAENNYTIFGGYNFTTEFNEDFLYMLDEEEGVRITYTKR